MKGASWRGTVGILTDLQINTLIDSMHSLFDIEESLYLMIQNSESAVFTGPRKSKQKSQFGLQRKQSDHVAKPIDDNENECWGSQAK